MEDSTRDINRRRFMGATAAAMFIRPELVRGTTANSAIRLGLIGAEAGGPRWRHRSPHTRIRGWSRWPTYFRTRWTRRTRRSARSPKRRAMPGSIASRCFWGPKHSRNWPTRKRSTWCRSPAPDIFIRSIWMRQSRRANTSIVKSPSGWTWPVASARNASETERRAN